MQCIMLCTADIVDHFDDRTPNNGSIGVINDIRNQNVDGNEFKFEIP